MKSLTVDRWLLAVLPESTSANGQLPTANREVAR
jgi:hypothetical protein